MKKKIILSIVSILIILFLINLFSKKEVTGIKINKQTYVENIVVSGVIQGDKNSILTNGVGGIVEKILYKEGDFVKSNNIIATLNTEEIDENIEKLKGEYLLAQINLEKIDTLSLENAKSDFFSSQIEFNISNLEFQKYKKLYEKGFVNILEFNIKKNNLFLSKKKLEFAKNNLIGIENGVTRKEALIQIEVKKNEIKKLEATREKYKIRAPYDLFILEKYITQGEYINSYTNLFQIVSKGNKIAKIDLDEKYIDKVKVGDSIKVYPYGSDILFSNGIIFYKGISINESDGTLELKALIKNPLDLLLYNGSINAIISGRVFKNTFLVSNSYILNNNNNKYLFIYKNNKAKLIEIKGQDVLEGFLITNINEDDIIILNPQNIKENEKVKVNLQTSSKKIDFNQIF